MSSGKVGSAAECGARRGAARAGVHRLWGAWWATWASRLWSVAVVVSVGVEQNDAAGVLVLGGMDQRPHRGVRQIGCAVMGRGGHRAAGQDHQACVAGVGVGQPVLQPGQSAPGSGHAAALPGAVGGIG